MFNLNDITQGPFKSVAELIDLEESLNVPAGTPTTDQWVFRGQSRSFGTLTPSFQRQFSRQSQGAAEVIERRLIDTFRDHYARLTERDPEMPDAAQIGVDRDLRCLSVMQHYEIPTRLLDWTSSFWTAIYFACATDPADTAELWYYHRSIFIPQRTADWSLQGLLDTSKLPPPEPLRFLTRRADSVITELDPRISPRMINQFAHHSVSTSIFSDHAPLLDVLASQAIASSGTDRNLHRVLIDGSCKGKALQFLAEQRDITASTLFPDVVGLGRFLRWQFESLRTMLL